MSNTVKFFDAPWKTAQQQKDTAPSPTAAQIVDSFEETETISQISTLKSFWGLNIPISSGTRMITGVPLWIGKKNGGRINFAVGLGYRTAPVSSSDNPKVIISKIWANDTLIMDQTGEGEVLARGIKFNLYSGTETQTPDPIIQAAEGADKTPAFRGMIYLVFHDFDLEAQGFFEPPVIRVEFTDRETFQPSVEIFASGPAVATALVERYPAPGTDIISYDVGPAVIASRTNRVYFLLSRRDLDAHYTNFIVCHNLRTGEFLFDGQVTNKNGTPCTEHLGKMYYLTGMNMLIVVTTDNITGKVLFIDPTTMKVADEAGHDTLFPYQYSFLPRLVAFLDDGEASKFYVDCRLASNSQSLTVLSRPVNVQYHQILLYGEQIFRSQEVNVLTVIKDEKGKFSIVGMACINNAFPADDADYTDTIGRYKLESSAYFVSGVATSDWSFAISNGATSFLIMTTNYFEPSKHVSVEPLSIVSEYPVAAATEPNSGILLRSHDPYGGKMRVVDRNNMVGSTEGGNGNSGDFGIWNFKVQETYGSTFEWHGQTITSSATTINFSRTAPSRVSFLQNDTAAINYNSVLYTPSDITFGSSTSISGSFNEIGFTVINETDIFASSASVHSIADPFKMLIDGQHIDDYRTNWPYYPATEQVSDPSWNSRDNTAYELKLGFGMVKYYPFGGDGSLLLASFLRWISQRAGFALSDISITGIDDVVWGSILNVDVDFWTLIGDLSKVYDFDVFESEGKIKFTRNLNLAAPIIDFSVTTDELAPLSATTFKSDGSEPSFKINRIGESSLPAAVRINYIDYLQSYRTSSSVARRMKFPKKVTQSDVEFEYSVPICMNPSEALTRATRILYDSWADRTTYDLRMPYANVLIEPGSYITVEERLPLELETLITTHTIKIVGVTTNADWSVSLQGTAFYSKERVEINVAEPTRDTPIISGVSEGSLLLFDVPMLAPEGTDLDKVLVTIPLMFIDTSVGTLAYVDHYSVGVGTSTFIGRDSVDTAYGRLQKALPLNTAAYSIDEENTITFSLVKGDMSQIVSQSEADFLAGTNFVAVGEPGNWEIISYRDVTVNGTNITLTGLLRGMRGTEANTIHDVGDYVISSTQMAITVLSVGADSLPSSVSIKNIGYKQSEFEANVDTFTINANYDKPFAPTNLTATFSGSDVVLAWNRRTRQRSTMIDGTADTPFLLEDDIYSVVIYNEDGDEVRVVENIIGPTFTYTAAMRTADGHATDVITYTVAQRSSMGGVGYGFWAPVGGLDIL